jgi:hypothetical protein
MGSSPAPFEVFINGGSGLDSGPWEDFRLPGTPTATNSTDYYTDTGTFSLSLSSTCPWTITVSPLSPRSTNGWVQVPGAATDISVGANGSVWALGVGPAGAGHPIYRWTGSYIWIASNAWARVPGAAVTIAVAPDGSPRVITSTHQIYRRVGKSWVHMPGAATDIAIGANGAVWVVGTHPNGGGYGIYHWTARGWAGVPGAAVTIAVAPDGSPWVITSTHQIYRRVGNSWVHMPGAATDIAIGANGAVWVVGTHPNGGGYRIYHWTARGWAGVPGAAVTIAVDPNGNPWVMNSLNQIYVR